MTNKLNLVDKTIWLEWKLNYNNIYLKSIKSFIININFLFKLLDRYKVFNNCVV